VSVTSLGAGWWVAADGLWYPPEAVPGTDPSPDDAKRSGRAVASLVCSCFGVVPFIGLVMAIVGIGLGISARRQIRKSEGWLVGDGIARAGIIVGSVLLALGIVITAILLATHDSSCDHQAHCASSSQGAPTATPAARGNPSNGAPSSSRSRSRSRSAGAPPGSTASGAAATNTTVPKPAATPPLITLSVSGDGTASSIAVLDGSGETEHTDVPLPYSTNVRPAGHYRVAIDAQAGSGDPSTSITCEINVPGRALVAHTSTGPDSVVDCNAGTGT
jgi:hypothetical protein